LNELLVSLTLEVRYRELASELELLALLARSEASEDEDEAGCQDHCYDRTPLGADLTVTLPECRRRDDDAPASARAVELGEPGDGRSPRKAERGSFIAVERDPGVPVSESAFDFCIVNDLPVAGSEAVPLGSHDEQPQARRLFDIADVVEEVVGARS
jgi:hypothetical protein